jgi:hypothetical protein
MRFEANDAVSLELIKNMMEQQVSGIVSSLK